MTRGGGGILEPSASGPTPHHPVLRTEAIAALQPRAGGLYVDGTFGAGGYSRAMLDIPGLRVLGIDRDPLARAAADKLAAEYPDRFSFHPGRFGDLTEVLFDLGVDQVDGVVFDIGVSSMQLDEADRGFSFRNDGPLDMRMESAGPTAADLVNSADEETLAAVIYRYGEERDSRRIARAIVADRVQVPFTRTKPLADMIGRVVRNSPKGVHPATKTFQALRIAVNDELGQLLSGLNAAEQVLAPGGVLAVVTFHSLEDRIVKRFFQHAAGRGGSGSRHLPIVQVQAEPSFEIGPKQPVTPSEAEIAQNPRARSAKLRFAVRTIAPPRGLDPDLRTLADLGLPQRR